MNSPDELLVELRAHKKESSTNFSFLAVVDIVNLRSTLLLCSLDEAALAFAAFGASASADDTTLDLGARVSRKKDFAPALSAAVARGWRRPTADELKASTPKEVFGDVVHECGPMGCSLRRQPSITLPSE